MIFSKMYYVREFSMNVTFVRENPVVYVLLVCASMCTASCSFVALITYANVFK